MDESSAQSANSSDERILAPNEYSEALRIARLFGRIKRNQPPSHEHSSVSGGYWILRDASRNEIHRWQIPKPGGFQSGGVSSNRAKAVAWARSMGYPVPEPPNGCATALLVTLGLLMFIVPGVMVLIWVAFSSQAYERDMNALVARWVEAGKPEPGIKSNTENKIVAIQSSASSIEQLKEYQQMLEQGLITSEEHEALRKKALGL